MMMTMEEMKPEYRFECKIVDEATGHDVVSASTFISAHIEPSGECESVDMEVGSMMRAFVGKFREKYEAEYYAKEEEEPI